MGKREMRIRWPRISLIKARLEYDPDRGILRYKARPLADFIKGKRPEAMCKMWNTRFAGKEWGSLAKSGHRKGNFDGVEIYTHHVIWALEKGRWPKFNINHIDGDPSNNQIANLREVAQSVVAKNQSLHRDNKSGASGVHRRKDNGKWQASIATPKGTKYLGCFTSFDDAAAARRESESQYGFHQNHGKRKSRRKGSLDIKLALCDNSSSDGSAAR